jgi:glycosyltransferase involved in cell wall biosynthesis
MATQKIILIRNAQPYDFGGGERFPVFIAEILASQQFAPLIISRSPKLLEFAKSRSLSTLTGPWWSHQNWSGKSALLVPIYIIWQLFLFIWYVAVFARHRPLAVHIQSKDDFIAATFAGRVVGARVIWTDHADLKHIWKNLRIWYKNPVGKLVYVAAYFAHTITLVSKSEQHLVTENLKQGIVVRKLQVIYNGVLDTASAYPPGNSHPFTFCVASRLVVDKGIGEVIDAYKQLIADFPDSRLLLMGDGPDAVVFHKQAADTPSISFLGYQSEPLAVMATADVFVHPTYHEGFSVALVEAGMLGLPIIATNVGGNVEIIDDSHTGLLVPVKNTVALSQAMRRLASDTSLRQTIGQAARQQYLQKYQFDHIVTNSFIPLYKGVAL